MSVRFVIAAGTALLLVVAPAAQAQLLVAKEGPVVYGHHHLTVSNVDEAKKFFVTALGGTDVTIGTSTAAVVKFANVFVFFQPRQPTGWMEDRQQEDQVRAGGAEDRELDLLDHEVLGQDRDGDGRAHGTQVLDRAAEPVRLAQDGDGRRTTGFVGERAGDDVLVGRGDPTRGR